MRPISPIDHFRKTVQTTSRAEELQSFAGQVIGTMCNFVPEELILAAGGVPVRMCAGSAEAEKEAEEIFPRDACPVVKSSLGLSMRGDGLWKRLDMLVVPTACDGKKKLAEILSRTVPVHVMSLPASKTAPGAREMWLHAVRLFQESLEKLTGHRIAKDRLRSAIEALNERARAFRQLFEVRRLRPSVITGEDALYVTNASFVDDPACWTKETLALCEALKAAHREGRFARPADAPRILLTGAPLIYPNFKVARVIESAGAVIAIDELCSGTQRLYTPCVPKEWTMKEMLIAVADKYLLPSTCPCFVESADRVNRLLELVEEFAVDGVVYHNLRMCQLHDVESFTIKAALARRNIPLLVVYSDYSPEDTPQLRTRVQAFLEMIGDRRPAIAAR